MSTIYYKDRLYDAIGRIAGEVVRAKGTAKLIAAVAGNIVGEWSGESRFKKRLTSPVDWVLRKISQGGDNAKAAPSPVIPAEVGRLITLMAAAVNEAHSKGVPMDDGSRGQSVKALLENMDFGEILEMVEGSDPYVLNAIKTFNEQLWKYPAKVGTLVATIIALLNIVIKSSREVLAPIEEAIGPDLLADIILSLLKGVKGSDAAKLADTVKEVIRRVHTGSLLLGKGGKSLFQIYLTDFITQFLSATDPELVRKIRIILAEDGEAIANAAADALACNPRIALSYLSSLGAVATSGVRAKSRRLDVVENLDGDGLKAAMSESVSDLDTYEIADLVNKACRAANRIRDIKPDVLSNLMNSVADSLDTEQIRNAAAWLIPDVVSALKPVAAQIMPLIITGLGELMIPEGGTAGTEHKEAMKAFRTALAGGGKS